MAGYREFQTGEVLTAANVNQFLMEQATMTFADAAARTAALSGVLREGLLTYNLDTARLEVYDGTDWVEPAPLVPGIGSNVVQTVKTDTFSTTSTSFVAVTGMSATITPSSETAKVLVVVQFTVGKNGPGGSNFQWKVVGGTDSYIGDTEGSRTRALGLLRHEESTQNMRDFLLSQPVVFVDDPQTASPVTYSLEVRVNVATSWQINQSETNDANNATAASSITLIEVAA